MEVTYVKPAANLWVANQIQYMVPPPEVLNQTSEQWMEPYLKESQQLVFTLLIFALWWDKSVGK